ARRAGGSADPRRDARAARDSEWGGPRCAHARQSIEGVGSWEKRHDAGDVPLVLVRAGFRRPGAAVADARRHGARTPHLRRDHVPALRPQRRVPQEHVDDHPGHRRPLGPRAPPPPSPAGPRAPPRPPPPPTPPPPPPPPPAHTPAEPCGLAVSGAAEPARHAEAARPDRRLPVEPQRRRLAALTRNLDVSPPDTLPPARPRTFIAASFAAKRAA